MATTTHSPDCIIAPEYVECHCVREASEPKMVWTTEECAELAEELGLSFERVVDLMKLGGITVTCEITDADMD